MTSTRWRNRVAICQLSLAATALLLVGADVDVVTHPVEVRQDPPADAPATGPRLQRTLDAPVPGVTWQNVPLRRILRQIGDSYGIAILRDRRVDPTATPKVAATDIPLRDILSETAADIDAEFRFVGNVAYVAPPDAAGIVRTLVELRRRELEGSMDRRSHVRRTALLRPKSVAWGDLAEPEEILRTTCDRFGLTIANPAVLPHDLWAGAVLPDVTAPEALTLVLIQFDLTFFWADDLRSIQLAPLPADRSAIVIEATYATDDSPADAIAEWRSHLPEFQARIDGRQVVVRGTVEQHESIARFIAEQTGSPPVRKRLEPNVIPLSRRRFSLTISNIPVRAVMTELEKTGVTFEYDADRLAESGIDLNTPASLSVAEADADEFCETLFGPIGVGCEIEGATIRLQPKQ